MNISTSQTETTQPIDSATVFARMASWFKKSVSEAALRDLDQITSNIDGHVESHAMPTRQEVDPGPAQAMRGGQANTQVEAHSNLLSQEGLALAYDKFNSMLGEMQKSNTAVRKDIATFASVLKGVVDGLTAIKADEKDNLDKTRAERDSAEDVATKSLSAAALAAKKAKDESLAVMLRKARIAIRKAEADDDEDEDEWKDKMEKAQLALDALNGHISKAEDEAEDDEDEKRSEKARNDLRTLKATLRKANEARVKKSAPVVAQAVADKSPAITKDDLTAALDTWAAAKGITVPTLFAQLGVKTTEVVVEPPTFAKAVADPKVTSSVIQTRIDDAVDNGVLKDNEIFKADSLKARFGAVKAGRYDTTAFLRELELAPPNVQRLFDLPVAA